MAGLSLQSIRLLILVRREHYYKISNIEKEKEATGIANVVGNKGGIGVAFSFYETSLCFVGAHLAAHLEMVPARNKNYHQLMRGLRLGRYPGDLHNQFDHLFFTGDLNYRIAMEREDVLRLIHDRRWETLYANDQLRDQRAQNKVFCEFNEGAIDFAPTYRYNRGDRTYSEEVRTSRSLFPLDLPVHASLSLCRVSCVVCRVPCAVCVSCVSCVCRVCRVCLVLNRNCGCRRTRTACSGSRWRQTEARSWYRTRPMTES
jgi:hypothetical protein